AVKALKTDFTVTQAQGSIKAESTVVFPDHMRADLETPQGKISIVVSPDASFMAAGEMGSRDLPASRKNESMEQIHRDLVYVSHHVSDPAFWFSAAGTDKADGAAIVDVSGPGVTMRWFVDANTGKVVREAYKGIGQSGPVDTETTFSDWKAVEGLSLP